MVEQAAAFFGELYGKSHLTSARRYPHDEMMRFIGRNFFRYRADDTFFNFDRPERKLIRILEVGCGTGSNLWAIAKEGFSAYGLDISPSALEFCKKTLAMWSVDAELSVGDMRKLTYPAEFFDGIVDIYSSYCLRQAEFDEFLSDVHRTLKPGGKFFCWNPSDRSEAFTNHAPARIIEPYTLDGIKRTTSPFFGNNYPFRFLTPETAKSSLAKAGLDLIEVERNGRTFQQTAEYFEWLSVTAVKPVAR